MMMCKCQRFLFFLLILLLFVFNLSLDLECLKETSINIYFYTCLYICMGTYLFSWLWNHFIVFSFLLLLPRITDVGMQSRSIDEEVAPSV